jgi:hypothetical protein
MTIVSLRDFLAFGRFGPISVGASRRALQGAFGEPEEVDARSIERRRPSAIMKYGDVEFHFESTDGRMSLIHIDRFSGAGRLPVGWGEGRDPSVHGHPRNYSTLLCVPLGRF